MRLARIGFHLADTVEALMGHPEHVHRLSRLTADNLEQLDRDAPIVVFCAGGYRSAIASRLLRTHGFAAVSDLLGGYTAWTPTGG